MNDLEELKDAIPKLKEDCQYSELAKKIGMAVSLGRSSVSMAFDQQLSDLAMDKLNDARVSVESMPIMGQKPKPYNYRFEF